MEVKSATKTFRQTVLLVSLALALITVVLMAAGFPDCETANLYFAMAMIFFVYSVVFIMMLLQFIGLVQCLKTIPRAIMGFYFLLVATMFYVQMILFKGENCSIDSPVLFFWLLHLGWQNGVHIYAGKLKITIKWQREQWKNTLTK